MFIAVIRHNVSPHFKQVDFCFMQVSVVFPVFPAPVQLLELPTPGLVIFFLLYTHVLYLHENIGH
jgi:hypothetical protein